MTDQTMAQMITAMIQTQVIQALNETPEAVDKLVKAAMSKPVDPSTGRNDGYSSGKVPYLEYLVGEELRMAAREVVHKIVQEQSKEKIEAMVREKVSGDDFVTGFASAIAASLKDDWRVYVSFEKEKNR